MKLNIQVGGWWKVATKFSVSYRQRFKFKGLSVTFGDLTAYPCLTLCLSFTTMLKKKQTKYKISLKY